jgi:hypothetical protein
MGMWWTCVCEAWRGLGFRCHLMQKPRCACSQTVGDDTAVGFVSRGEGHSLLVEDACMMMVERALCWRFSSSTTAQKK